MPRPKRTSPASRSKRARPKLRPRLTRAASPRKRRPEAPDAARRDDLFRMILEHMGDLVAVLDTAGRRLYNSPSYRQVLGRAEELRGSSSFDEIHPDDRAKVKQVFEETVRTGTGRRSEYRFVRSDGEIRHIESQGDVIRDESGRPANVVVVARDITERKRQEEELRLAYRTLQEAQAQLIQSEKLASIGQFAAGIVHDLRNPLGIIMGSAEFLKEAGGSDPKVLTEYVDMILEGTARANAIVKGLLSLSRRNEVKLAPADIRALLGGCLDLLRKEHPGASLELRTRFADALPEVRLDSDQMQHVLLNLLSNAVQAMPGGGRIEMAASTSEARMGMPRVGRRITDFFREGDPVLVVEVSDTGAGIPEGTLQKIFEPFFTTKPRGEGTGLGLAIVRSIVEAHRGTIEARSRPGVGTTFTITLPLRPPASQEH